MVKNDGRRVQLLDAAIVVLAREGGRGLTHRAVDRQAGVPGGTTSNYFRRRDELVAGLMERITERLTPEAAVHAGLAGRTPDRALFADYLRDIVRRLTADREVTLTLFELRLEAARRPEIAAVLSEALRAGLDVDVAFNEGAGLPGGPLEISLFHYAIDGLLLDRLTTPIDPGTSTDEIIDALVAGLLPDET